MNQKYYFLKNIPAQYNNLLRINPETSKSILFFDSVHRRTIEFIDKDNFTIYYYELYNISKEYEISDSQNILTDNLKNMLESDDINVYLLALELISQSLFKDE